MTVIKRTVTNDADTTFRRWTLLLSVMVVIVPTLAKDSSTTVLADNPSTPIPSSTPTTSQRPVSQERSENLYKPATQSYDSTLYSESSKDEGTFAVLADSDVRILQTDDGKAVVIVEDDKKEDGRFRVTKETTFDINGYQSDEGTQIDAEFKRLPPLEIVNNEVLSELNVKQVLECNLPSNVTYSHWSKNGEKMNMVLDAPRVRSRLLLTKTGHAIISRVSKSDDGSWVCHGFDTSGASYAADAIKLIVLEMPFNATIDIDGKKIMSNNVSFTTEENFNLTITCNTRGGRPKPKLSWFIKMFNGNWREVNKYDKGFDVKIDETALDLTSTLKFSAHKSYNNATVSCTMSHPSLTRSLHSIVILNVIYTPRFDITRYPGFGYPLYEGSAVALRCEVDSNPPVEPKWLCGNQDPPVPQRANGFLNFTYLTTEHTGWYKCTANHSQGDFSSIGYLLNVRKNPLMETSEPEDKEKQLSGKVEVALGGVVQLQCPTGSIGCWGKKSDEGEWYGAGSTAPHGALSISGFLYQEAGEYRCEGLSSATQGQLQVLREATIVVTGGPTVFPTNRTVLVSEGQNATFSAEYCANPAPTRVVWISSERLIRLGEHSGQIVAHNATNSSSPGCSIAQLTIEPAGLQHNGEFSLLVRNPQGSKEAVFQLAVTATRKVSKTENILNDWLGISASTRSRTDFSYIVFCISFVILIFIERSRL